MKASLALRTADTRGARPGRLFVPLAFLVGLGTMLGATLDAPAAEVHWSLYDAATEQAPAPPEGDLRISCGGYGFFDLRFGTSTTGIQESMLSPAQDGVEVPSGYPRLAPEPPPARLDALEPVPTETRRGGLVARTFSGERPATAAGPATRTVPLPCDGGSCFGPPGPGPWAAVLDWNHWHGWSVGWTLLTLANFQLPAVLFPVDDPRLEPYFGDQVTDLHVLVQLCRVADAAADPALSAPVVVNMSFGRLATALDAGDAACDPSTLTCQIGAVIDYLRSLPTGGPNPTLFAASAGNHGLPLFPAAYSAVLATGALDLARYDADATALPCWETPPDAAALFPGNSVCLEYDAGGQQAYWPAPPGSSYATAVVSGWLGSALAEQSIPAAHLGLWTPDERCSGGACAYLPSRNGNGYGSSQPPPGHLLTQLLGRARSACGYPPASMPVVSRSLGPAQPLGALPSVAFPEVSPLLHHPTPEPSPCVPCDDGNGLNGNLRLAPAAAALTTGSASGDLVVGLWASPPLTAGISLDAVYLRVDDQLYEVLLSPADLSSLAAGTLGRLGLTGSGALVAAAKGQPSLVYALRETPPDGAPETSFWSSSPLLLHLSGTLLTGSGGPSSPGGSRAVR